MAMSTADDHNDDDAEDGSALFRRAAGRVRPLRAAQRVTAPATRPAPRRRPPPAAEPPAAPGFTPARDSPFAQMDDPSPNFHRGGLQHGVLKRLRRGQLRPQAQLDLHGLTLVEAGQQLAQFLHHCQARGIRQALIIHGKGSRSPGGHAVLKPQALLWLRQHPAVLALEPALPRDGGEGAVYALLKRG